MCRELHYKQFEGKFCGSGKIHSVDRSEYLGRPLREVWMRGDILLLLHYTEGICKGAKMHGNVRDIVTQCS